MFFCCGCFDNFASSRLTRRSPGLLGTHLAFSFSFEPQPNVSRTTTFRAIRARFHAESVGNHDIYSFRIQGADVDHREISLSQQLKDRCPKQSTIKLSVTRRSKRPLSVDKRQDSPTGKKACSTKQQQDSPAEEADSQELAIAGLAETGQTKKFFC